MAFNNSYYDRKSASDDNNLEFKNWNVFFVQLQEKIFEIAAIEPAIYYRKIDLLKFTMHVKSLLTITKTYMSNDLQEISQIDKLIAKMTSKDFMKDIIKETNKAGGNHSMIFIQDERTIMMAKQIVNIFEQVLLNLSLHELLPKSKLNKQSSLFKDIDEQDKQYFEFVNYLEN